MLPSRILNLLGLSVLTAAPMVAQDQPSDIVSFIPGTTARSSEVNANFDLLEKGILDIAMYSDDGTGVLFYDPLAGTIKRWSQSLVDTLLDETFPGGVTDPTTGFFIPGTSKIESNAMAIGVLDGRLTQAELDILGFAVSIQQNIDDIITNVAAIAGNAFDIGVNADDILVNVGDIAINAANIAANTGAIMSNAGNITTLQAQITAGIGTLSDLVAKVDVNTVDIASNMISIADNRSDIDINESEIAANRSDIDINRSDIADNGFEIANNQSDIADNRSDIANNESAILALDGRVNQNETDIAVIFAAIAGNVDDIATLSGDLVALTGVVAQNSSDIAANSAAIAILSSDLAVAIASINSSIDQVSSALAALDVRVSQNEADIIQNTTDIAANVSDIDDLQVAMLDHESRIGDLEYHMSLLRPHGQATFYSDGSWTVPEAVDTVFLTLVGGGGGAGHRAAGLPEPDYQGGDGGSLWRSSVSVAPGQVLNFTIGQGGQSTNVGGTSASDGGMTVVTSSSILVNSVAGGAGASVGAAYGGTHGLNAAPLEGPALRHHGNGASAVLDSSGVLTSGAPGMIVIEW